MREHGVPVSLCAAILALSPSTILRRARPPSAAPTRVPRPIDAVRAQHVRDTVRTTHGLVGAQSLGRMHGLPRRTCAVIKRRELTEMEHERKARCAQVSIAMPGVVRGFDAMSVQAIEGRRYWLVAADASIPYRTSIATVPAYDATHVMAALRADFELHGPPLVLRWDRIACQRTPDIDSMLDEYQVLALHGPPRHPYYYGQLERQNREHRAWYAHLGPISETELASAAARMTTALNAHWARPSLDGWTAEQAWNARRSCDVDRGQLRRDVETLAAQLVSAGVELLRARRHAIERALRERGLLDIKHGGWC